MGRDLKESRVGEIARMEQHLNEAKSVVQAFAEALEEFQRSQIKINELSKYYGSAEWYRDLEDYDNGKLPQDLKCGVLSEDLVYNLLMQNRELAIEMLETATQIIKH